MRANYEVYECPGTWESDTVARVTIDVCDDPTHLDNCIDAVKAAGYDPYERCSRGCGPAYNARFVGYADGNEPADREFPDGYTDQHDSDLWNVGHVFRWSNVYEAWLDCEIRLTVKPNVPIDVAFEDSMGERMWSEYAVFFSSSF